MVNSDSSYRKSIIFAVVLHVLIFAALLFHFTSKSNHYAAQPSANIINATVINQTTASQATMPQPAKPVEKQQPVKQEQIKEPQKPPQKVEPQKTEAQQNTQQLAEQQAELKKQKQEKVAEQKRLLAEHMKQELAAEEKKAKAKQKLAAKKVAEQSAKQMMQQELAASENTNINADAKASAAQSAQSQGEIDKYKTLIIQAISNKWIVPEDLEKGLEAKLLVRLAPGGMVMDVKVIKSSGNEALDRSAETAVYKASPLPVPEDAALFGKFRTINLTVRPEGILTNG